MAQETKNVEQLKAFQGYLTQAEVNYTPLSPQIGVKACASCRWFMNNGCFIVESYPEPIIATGLSDRWEIGIIQPPPAPEPIPVVIVEPTVYDTDSAEMALPIDRKGLKELVLGWFKPTTLSTPVATRERAFTVFKGKDDKWYWMARHTGKYVDREDEILADKAHEEYVERVQKGLVPMPELWTWHKKGTSHGVADVVWKSGGFVRAIGHFTGTKEQVERSVKYYQEHPDTKLSHMFKYPKNGKKRKVYYAYNTVEITTLPDGAEAFPYTTFEGLGTMPFTKQMEDQIRGIGGEEMWQRALAADTKDITDTKTMDAAGVASKNQEPSHENFAGSTIPEDDEVKALQVATKDFDQRLKTIEGLGALLTTLDASVKSLTAELATSKQAAADALAKANANEKALLEFKALAPPASKSDDTLLGEREASLLQQVAKTVEAGESKSLIEQMYGSPTQVSG